MADTPCLAGRVEKWSSSETTRAAKFAPPEHRNGAVMTATEIRETSPAAVTGTGTVPASQDGARPDGAAGAVWDALAANPGATVAELSDAAGVSRTTTARTLTALENDGRASRTPGERDGGKRLPDRWTLAPVATGGDDAAADHNAADGKTAPSPVPGLVSAPTDDDAATDGITALGTGHETATEEDAPSPEPGDGDAMDADALAEASEALTAMREVIDTALTALASGDRAEAMAAAETLYGGSGKARRLVRTAVNGRPRNATGQSRSNPGEMRAKVAAHLAAHPSVELTPHEISKVIGHSAGAIANALDRLVGLGEAVQMCERPRRFTAVPTAEDAPRPAANDGR
jgi:hypothetical protein